MWFYDVTLWIQRGGVIWFYDVTLWIQRGGGVVLANNFVLWNLKGCYRHIHYYRYYRTNIEV